MQWPLRPSRRYRLPDAPSALIGREREREVIKSLLLRDKTRLLTLVGPPGVGKTRLAIALAELVEEKYEHGIAFVDLSPLRDPRTVLDAIAQSFGLRQQGKRSPADQLLDYLQDMSVLLVLDNFEHLLQASTDLSYLLAHAPGVVVLATSRTALHLRWEQVYEVPPLQPAAGLEFFIDRARARGANFVCPPADVPVVTEICARLDGLPLAIELAAARCVVLSPSEILSRLSRRLLLLTNAPRDASARHRTLRQAIDWSYDLLSHDERALLRHVSVFVGGFTIDAAEAVCNPTSGTTFDCLSTLISMSLVRVEPASDGAAQSRFSMLETVREYAWEHLVGEGEADEAQLRHAEYWREFVETRYALNFGPDQPAFAAHLERNHANLRQALSWALQSRQVDLALRLGGGLHWFWYGRGYLAEGLQCLEQALASADSVSLSALAVGSRTAGALALNMGRFADALVWLEAAVDVGRQRGPDPSVRSELAMALGIRGVTQIAAGQYDAAEVSIRGSLTVFETLADEWGIATAREVLGAIAALRGDAEAANELAAEALAVHRRLGGRENIGRALDVLGYAAALRGDLARANSCFEESLALRRAAPNRPATATVLARLGLVAYLGRQWERAVVCYRESLALAEEIGDDAGVVRCLGQVAALALACGVDRGSIARLGSAVQHHHRALGLPSPPVEQVAARRLADALRAEISPVSLAAAWLRGRVLGLAQATRLGVSLLDNISAQQQSLAASASERLTPRERQVAVLVAHGLTNRQIAEELVVAQRTVDTHVERILAKLNVAARAQIAAWVAQQGLLQPAGTDHAVAPG